MPKTALSPEQAIRKVKSFVKTGNAEKALVLCNAVLERFPDNRRVISEIDAIARRAGAEGQGTVFLQAQIVKLAAHYHAGRFDDVVTLGEALLRVAPGTALIHNLVGAALQALGRHSEAVEAYRAALTHKPDYDEVQRSLGDVLVKLERYGEASAALDAAIAARGEEAETLTWRGDALSGLGRDAEALAAYDRALEVNPKHAIGWNARALCLERLGRIDEAVANLRKALEILPDYIAARLNLARVQTFEEIDQDVAQMAKWWAGATLSHDDRMILGFALGKAYDDIGEVDKAFAVLREANRLRKQALGYDIQAHKDLVATVAMLHRERLADAASWFQPEDQIAHRPVFIIGMPRSGTSLVEQILASHSAVFGAGELSVLDKAVRPALPLLASEDIALRRQALRAIRDAYAGFLAGFATDRPLISDKMPVNFLWAGIIHAAFPEAILIHTIRDPAAACLSNWKHNFTDDGLGFSFDLEDVARFHRLKDALMALWHAAMPGRIYDLNYERLTENQDGETRALLSHCGLDFEAACLDFHKTERSVRTASARQVRQTMYRGSSEAWRAYEAYLGPMLDILNGPLPRI
ncbi:sulfotransferase [Jiella sp. MQZ9-1]|uniref:Sulfotransferase n=1 Tax=Jiella flava TaxID=2816857 RepID=A0A939FU64_9HYPH|nr:sulfotransferase [Jiella flava]MBO0662003.1 sulfotransferase [Jiella flava]MCD2470670.1 sulfotransferase [Jiella flava]